MNFSLNGVIVNQSLNTQKNNSNRRTFIALEFVLRFLSYGKSIGVPVDSLLSFFTLDLRKHTKKPGFVPGHIWEGIVALGIECCERRGDSLAGLNASIALGNSFLGLWGFISEKSDTLGVAIEVAVAYKKLHANTLEFYVERLPGYLDLIISPTFRLPSPEAHAADFYLLQLVRLIQQCTGEASGVVESVHLKHTAPAKVELIACYSDYFKCPVYFARPSNKIRIFASALNLPLVTADTELKVALEPSARAQISHFDESEEDFEALTRSHLKVLFNSKQATKENLAHSLGMSPRTLLRKLHITGTSYRILLHDLRYTLAQQYLLEPSLNMTFIATQLSFNDLQSFSRWFTKQTGVSPSIYRELHLSKLRDQ